MKRETSAVLGDVVSTLTKLVEDQTSNVGLTARLVGDVAQIKVQVDLLETDLKDCVNELCRMCNEHKGIDCDGCRWLAVEEEMR